MRHNHGLFALVRPRKYSNLENSWRRQEEHAPRAVEQVVGRVDRAQRDKQNTPIDNQRTSGQSGQPSGFALTKG